MKEHQLIMKEHIVAFDTKLELLYAMSEEITTIVSEYLNKKEREIDKDMQKIENNFIALYGQEDLIEIFDEVFCEGKYYDN